MTKQINEIPIQIQGGDNCLLGRKSNSEPPASVSIPLASNKGFALIDAEDYGRISKHRWYLLKKKHTSYAITSIKTEGKWKTVRMHRLIMDAPKNKDVDHWDRNGLNNQKHNLRVCTRQQNAMNRREIASSSKYKGVTFRESEYNWHAHITVNGRRRHLGNFHSEIDAAKAYNEAAIKDFGEFAYLNKIETMEVA